MSILKLFSLPKKSDFQSQSGQAAIITMGIMIILLAVGLSLASRTSQEVELAGQQEDTTRVFNAAESGIEEALSNESNFIGTNAPAPTTFTDDVTNTSRTVTVEPQTGFENRFESGETATVFIDKTKQGEIAINWGKTNSCADAALVITTYYSESGVMKAKHEGVRPVNCYGATKFSEEMKMAMAHIQKSISTR